MHPVGATASAGLPFVTFKIKIKAHATYWLDGWID